MPGATKFPTHLLFSLAFRYDRLGNNVLPCDTDVSGSQRGPDKFDLGLGCFAPGGASRAERDDAAAVGSLSRDRGLTYRHSLPRWDPILPRRRHIQIEIFSPSTRPLSLHLNVRRGRCLPTHGFFAEAFHGWRPICHPSRSSTSASASSPYPRASTDRPIAVFPLIGSLCHRYEVSVTSRCCIGGPARPRPGCGSPSRPSGFGELPDQFHRQYANLLPARHSFSASRSPGQQLARCRRSVWFGLQLACSLDARSWLPFPPPQQPRPPHATPNSVPHPILAAALALRMCACAPLAA